MCPFLGTRGALRCTDRLPVGCGLRREVVWLWIPLLLAVVVCQGLPVIGPQRGEVSSSAISQAVVFLTRYGYLPSSDPNSESLRSEQQLLGALSAMQRFAGLPPTGRVDEETLRLMRRRRCGLPDLLPGQMRHRVRRYAIQGQKWLSTTLSWSVKSVESEEPMVRSQLQRAFRVWSDSSPLTFVEVHGANRSADIVVSFLRGPHGDGYPFDGEGAVLAHAFFPGEGIGGDAHFDAEERWLPSQPQDEEDGVNLFAVAAHEIGHSLGLSHSSTPGSLMFPYYQVMGEHFALPKDDADGIKHLYGVKEPKNLPTMPAMPATSSTPTPTTGKSATTTQIPSSTSTVATPRPPTAMPPVPDVCNTTIDAISVIRREIFVFKGKYFWRVDRNLTLRAGYPVSVDRFWYDLPANITHVDALYERPTDTKIVFFSGRLHWVFSANRLEPGYPRPLSDLGLPGDLGHVDAALVWGHNGKTYLFSGEWYWKLDEAEGRVELDYPRHVRAWRGVPPDIDAAFQWADGNTYFFKGSQFWKFNDVKMRVDSVVSSDIGGFWFTCPGKTLEKTETVTTARPVILETAQESRSGLAANPSLHWVVVALLVAICIH